MAERYVIVRGRDSGCFAGVFTSRAGQEVKLKDSRRIWYWAGAASLSELAVKGTIKPEECKFPAAIPEHEVLDAVEVIDCTDAARKSIEAVKVWSAEDQKKT